MLIGGYQKLTLIDYPGQVAATVFTVGCNFRCPFCHNPELVLSGSGFAGSGGADKKEKEVVAFLKTRLGKLDGVCVTGGEPTIQPDLLKFLAKLKKMGFLVKLDTNGTRPDVLRKAYEKKLVDFVAMDIKSSLERYAAVCGASVDLDRIRLSAQLMMDSRRPYEFRTTVVPSLHRTEDFESIGKWLDGAERYALQTYRDEGRILDESLKKKVKSATIELKEIEKIMRKHFQEVLVRE